MFFWKCLLLEWRFLTENKIKYQSASFSSPAKVLDGKMGNGLLLFWPWVLRLTQRWGSPAMPASLWAMALSGFALRNERVLQSLLIALLSVCLTQWLLSLPYAFGICWAGGVISLFWFTFFPMPFSFFGVCVLKQNASLICYCSSSCGFVWLGRKKISAQMVLYVPSICFDCVTNCLL